jgi:hypothetical protein
MLQILYDNVVYTNSPKVIATPAPARDPALSGSYVCSVGGAPPRLVRSLFSSPPRSARAHETKPPRSEQSSSSDARARDKQRKANA